MINKHRTDQLRKLIDAMKALDILTFPYDYTVVAEGGACWARDTVVIHGSPQTAEESKDRWSEQLMNHVFKHFETSEDFLSGSTGMYRASILWD